MSENSAPLTPSSDIPRAYQIGKVDFYGREFCVDPRVLIPRPETEQLIDAVLKLAGKAYLPGVRPEKRVIPENAQVLDVGTGSGCIAVTLALELPECQVVALDVDRGALEVAQENARRLGVTGVEFAQSDLLGWYRGASSPEPPDVIVANLPYVSPEWDWIGSELKYEPARALFAGDGGLKLIKKLILQLVEQRSADARWRGRQQYLILEADPCQHADIIKYAARQGLEHVETRGFALTILCKRQG